VRNKKIKSFILGTNACNGDSGGGLTMHLEGRWFVRGLVSLGVSKNIEEKGVTRYLCNTKYYTLYTDLANYMEWIVQHVPDIQYQMN